MEGCGQLYDVVAGEQRLNRAVWTYNQPSERFRELAGWFAFYPGQMDGCWVNCKRVIPQQGGSTAVDHDPG